MDNILTWDRENLISILIVGYDINFARCIQTKIHIRVFSETTTFSFPYLMHQLYDTGKVLHIPEVDHWIEVTYMIDISLIKDAANLFLTHRAYPLSSSGMTHFEGHFIPAKPVK